MLDEPILEMLFQLLPELWTDWKILRKDGDHPAVFRKVGREDIKDFLRLQKIKSSHFLVASATRTILNVESQLG